MGRVFFLYSPPCTIENFPIFALSNAENALGGHIDKALY